jgi:hypothetical protein
MTSRTASRVSASRGAYAGWHRTLDASCADAWNRIAGALPRRGAQFWRGTGVGCMRKAKA